MSTKRPKKHKELVGTASNWHVEVMDVKLKDQLSDQLDKIILPYDETQKLLSAFKQLGPLLTDDQLKLVYNEIIMPLVNHANKRYDDGFSAAEMAHEEWQEIVDEQDEWYQALEDGGY